MKLRIIAVGKIKSRSIQNLVDEYLSRLVHYLPTEIVVVKDDARALSKLEPTDHLIVLDERGQQRSSVELSELLSDHQGRGTKTIVLFIGGEDGVGSEVKARANMLLGLSKMTFPHELVQAMLLEQLYQHVLF